MKKYEVYTNIRKKALIYGLPIAYFALMMLSILGSLLVVIFSFSLGMIILVLTLNLLLYFLLIRLNTYPQLLKFRSVFPQMISNKNSTGLSYEN